jgi:hypothetical protein
VRTSLIKVGSEVHQQIAGLLGHPVAGRMGGDTCQMHAPGAVLDENSMYKRRRNTVPAWKNGGGGGSTLSLLPGTRQQR